MTDKLKPGPKPNDNPMDKIHAITRYIKMSDIVALGGAVRVRKIIDTFIKSELEKRKK
jgi:hypothetical protein